MILGVIFRNRNFPEHWEWTLCYRGIALLPSASARWICAVDKTFNFWNWSL